MAKRHKLPTQEELHRLFVYNEQTGNLIWNSKASRNTIIGKVAGYIDVHGYRIIRVNKVAYRAHRLVYKYHTNKEPGYSIDHINRIQTDNRIENLREATQTEQNINRQITIDNGGLLTYIDKEGKRQRNALGKEQQRHAYNAKKNKQL